MKIDICATPVSLAAFVVAVFDNVRRHHLQECLYYRIQEEGNYSRGCIIVARWIFFLGWGGVGDITPRWWVYSAGGESDTHCLCMLTSACKWMCGENSTGGSSVVRQIKGVGWGCRVNYCRMVGELSNIHTGPMDL